MSDDDTPARWEPSSSASESEHRRGAEPAMVPSSRRAGSRPRREGRTDAGPGRRPRTPPVVEEAEFGKPVTAQPTRQSRLVPWLLVGLCLLVALPGLLLELGRPDATNGREQTAVARSVQTYRRWVSNQDPTASLAERLVPQFNGQARYADPPGITWAHMSLFHLFGADPDQPAADFLLQARLAGVLAALLAIASVFWAARCISDTSAAALAALALAGNPVFLYFARLGTDSIHLLGWSLFSLAAALWAIRPLRPAPSTERQFIGWVLCGLSLGLAILLGGWFAAAWVVLPLAVVMILCPNRVSHLMGLVAATLIGVLSALPWAVFAHVHDPEAWTLSLNPLGLAELYPTAATAAERTLPMSWALIGLAVMPWPIWLIAAVTQPFSTSSQGQRRRFSLGWSWLLSGLCVLGIGTVLAPRHVLMLLPVVCVLVAELFRLYRELAKEGRHPRIWRISRWPHAGLLLGVSLLVLAWPWVAGQSWMPAAWQSWFGYADFGWRLVLFWAGLGLTLLGLWALSVRWMLGGHPGRAAVCWALWTLVLSSCLTVVLTRSPAASSGVEEDAKQVAIFASGRSLYWVRSTAVEPSAPDPALLLYTQREIPVLLPKQVSELAGKSTIFYLLTSPDRPPSAPGFRVVAKLPSVNRVLWRHDGTPQEVVAQAAPSRRGLPSG